MKTAIIVVNYRTPWHTDKCLEGIFKHTSDFHLFLVQNAPDLASISVGEKYQAAFPDQVTVIKNETNLGYVGGVNSAYVQAMNYERVCLVNSDLIVTAGWLSNMNKVLDEHADVVQVYPDSNSHYPEKFIWKLVKKLPFVADKLYRYQLYNNPPRSQKRGFEETTEFYWAIGGYCNLFRTEPFKDKGYFLDPNIVHGYWDDFDLAFYLRQFGKVGTCYDSYVFHFLNTSFKNLKMNPQTKTLLAFYNGLYVMDKWHTQIHEELKNLSAVEFTRLVEFSSVIQMYAKYLGTINEFPQIMSEIQLEVVKIGKEFLN